MPFSGFWTKLEKPIIGLAPMDGVTDASFRYMICNHSKPSVVITEFTNVRDWRAEMRKD
jgi:tRNA-dihydrouridine synthase